MLAREASGHDARQHGRGETEDRPDARARIRGNETVEEAAATDLHKTKRIDQENESDQSIPFRPSSPARTAIRGATSPSSPLSGKSISTIPPAASSCPSAQRIAASKRR